MTYFKVHILDSFSIWRYWYQYDRNLSQGNLNVCCIVSTETTSLSSSRPSSRSGNSMPLSQSHKSQIGSLRSDYCWFNGIDANTFMSWLDYWFLWYAPQRLLKWKRYHNHFTIIFRLLDVWKLVCSWQSSEFVNDYFVLIMQIGIFINYYAYHFPILSVLNVLREGIKLF